MTAAATGRDPYGGGGSRARDRGAVHYWVAVLYFVLFMSSIQARRPVALLLLCKRLVALFYELARSSEIVAAMRES